MTTTPLIHRHNRDLDCKNSQKDAAHMVRRAKASGASEEQVQQKREKLRNFKDDVQKPVVNLALTFAELFPIGLAVTLISAATLRKKQAAQTA